MSLRPTTGPTRLAIVTTVVTTLVTTLALAACTREGERLAEPSATTSTAPAATTDTSATTPGASEPIDEQSPGETTMASGTQEPTADTTVEISTTVPPTVVDATEVSVAEVAEVGVPGLDSTDAFCAAWSRFAGSFQVVAVTAAFGSGPPEELAALEVAASPVVTDAYDALLANWPDELSSEADVVADRFLGPFARRLDVAREALADADADASLTDDIAEAWLAGLARRDPSTPEFTVDLAPEAWTVIDAAAADFGARLVPFSSDPSLVTDVQTPLTDEYLARSCPDQGALSGQEVDAP